MKRNTLSLLAAFFVICASAQTLAEKVSLQSCDCIGKISTLDSLELKFKSCFGQAMTTVTMKEKDLQFSYTVENIQRLASEVFNFLPSACPQIKKMILEKRAKIFYSQSTPAANKYFERGNTLLQAQNFEGAITEFKLAIKQDKKFVLAIDNLAVCYRSINQFKEAIKFYNQSLSIFPEGEIALVNTGAIYIIQNEFDNARDTYQKIVQLYPQNPEGYFGLSKIALMQEKYEAGLEPTCIAHRIYTQTNSPFLSESEKIIGILFVKLKQAGKEEFFKKTLQQYDIEFVQK
jgi:tetratricopeptide (TPR) repeat protein